MERFLGYMLLTSGNVIVVLSSRFDTNNQEQNKYILHVFLQFSIVLQQNEMPLPLLKVLHIMEYDALQLLTLECH